MDRLARRDVLRIAGAGGVVGLAGCLGDQTGNGPGARDPDEVDDIDTVDPEADAADGPDDPPADANGPEEELEIEGVAPPTADRGLPVDYSIQDLNDAARSGGPPPDGIPAIETPSFNGADDPPPNLSDGDPVFGVAMNGEARAYPQYNLVWHEIVNDEIAGEPVSVTYCPLTGTAQGFKRGDTTFGVSGQLINTNLVMFDREHEDWWPQMLATGITGEHAGDHLVEFQVIWTTWERWRARYPETTVLNEETGHARDYGRDPYGSYNPIGGYYENDRTLFPPLTESDRFHPKAVVLGMRNRDGAMCVPKHTLREQKLIEGTVNGVAYVTVYDPRLDTGFVYRNPDEHEVRYDDGVVTLADQQYWPDQLSLERVIAYDALWLAWYGYYPSTAVHE